MLGGTTIRLEEADLANKPTCPRDRYDAIYARCCRVIPALLNAKIIRCWSGVRPYREGGARLELEGQGTIHNYGHGGSGVTVAWGCADQVVVLAAQTLTNRHHL